MSTKETEVLNNNTSPKDELEVLVLYGLPLPVAGLSGVPLARDLREGLLLVRDLDGEFENDPQKQMLVDRLIEKLAVIPMYGLSEDADIPEIVEMAKKIGVTHVKVNDSLEEEEEISDVIDEDRESQNKEEVKGEAEEKNYSKETKAEGLSQDDQKAVFVSRKDMVIEVGDDDGEVVIEVLDKAENKQSDSLFGKPDNRTDKHNLSPQAVAEKLDVVNTIIHPPLPKIEPASAVLNKDSLVSLYLSKEPYSSYIVTNYSSLFGYEKLLDVSITKFEAETVDKFEQWLGEKHKSCFVFIQNLTIREVAKLASGSQVRKELSESNVKYETFTAWVDLIDEMLSVVGENADMTFGELYARWKVESGAS